MVALNIELVEANLYKLIITSVLSKSVHLSE